MDRVESSLQFDTSNSTVTTIIEVKNPKSYPIHVMDVEVVFEEAGREKGELKGVTTKVSQSCIVLPRSSKLLKLPVKPSEERATAPYMVKANLNVKDKFQGAYQVSTGRVKQLFYRDPAPKKPPTPSPTPRFDGQIEVRHLKTFFPKEVQVAFELQVRNSNFLPLKFLHADFVIRSGATEILRKKVPQNTSIPRNSTQLLKLEVGIPLEAVRRSFPEASTLPVEMDITFWFKETFYGMYKIDSRKTGVIVIPVEPEIRLQKVVFGFEENKPVARLQLLISNANPFDLELGRVEYQAFSRETGSSLILAKFKREKGVHLASNGSVVVAAVARPSSHEFGSVLWELCTPEPNYTLKSVIEADTQSYGKIVFQS